MSAASHGRTPADRRGERRTRIFLWVFGALMVATAGTAFVFKLYEFAYVATRPGGDAVASFLIPLLNYLLVAAGFGCLLAWAYVRGEFRDVEGCKRRMLEVQLGYERADARARRGGSHGR